MEGAAAAATAGNALPYGQPTGLKIELVTPPDLDDLPTHLLELEVHDLIRLEDEHDPYLGTIHFPLQLSHLTALTSLKVQSGKYEVDTHALGVGDTLPPNLRVLKWADACSSIEPIVGLSQLQQLDMSFGGTHPSPADLRRLSSLQNLRRVQLHYTYADTYDAETAAAWSVLPLKSLQLKSISSRGVDRSEEMTAAFVKQIGLLTTLTRLELGDDQFGAMNVLKGVSIRATVQELAAALSKLSALQKLTIACVDSVAGDQEGGLVHSTDGVVALIQAIAGLELRQLYVKLPLQLQGKAAVGTVLAALEALALQQKWDVSVTDRQLLMKDHSWMNQWAFMPLPAGFTVS